MHLLNLLTTLLALPLLTSAGLSSIILPENGTHVLPGQRFAFRYSSSSDYCESSYFYNIYIITTPPENFALNQTWATGAFMGRVAEYNPPYVSNPPPQPDHLIMPNFTQSFGEFGTGVVRTDVPVYLVVLEESQWCAPSFGVRIGLQYVTLIYNSSSYA